MKRELWLRFNGIQEYLEKNKKSYPFWKSLRR